MLVIRGDYSGRYALKSGGTRGPLFIQVFDVARPGLDNRDPAGVVGGNVIGEERFTLGVMERDNVAVNGTVLLDGYTTFPVADIYNVLYRGPSVAKLGQYKLGQHKLGQ